MHSARECYISLTTRYIRASPLALLLVGWTSKRFPFCASSAHMFLIYALGYFSIRCIVHCFFPGSARWTILTCYFVFSVLVFGLYFFSFLLSDTFSFILFLRFLSSYFFTFILGFLFLTFCRSSFCFFIFIVFQIHVDFVLINIEHFLYTC